ncbi:DDE-type integrase/transposase/recombinase, partial [Leisingera daeponensis]|uniref:DDE-type integrase/transposase/recombinase n=1 Tax=Leisingera daeponensis TaxID=405746 RepID=UPI0021BDCBAE
MKKPSSLPRLKGFRFPREIVAYAVWVYHRFALSAADVEDLLSERGVIDSRETIRQWVNRFGRFFADCIRRDRPGTAEKWHLDEVVIPINGRKFWLWRAVDVKGDVLDILVPPRQGRCFRPLEQLCCRNKRLTGRGLTFLNHTQITWQSLPIFSSAKALRQRYCFARSLISCRSPLPVPSANSVVLFIVSSVVQRFMRRARNIHDFKV